MDDEIILKIRNFNRFYLSVMDFYENNYLNSDYSITESRVLYELYGREGCTADDITKKLHLDKGYLSRIIKRFEKGALLKRQKSELDARSYQIHLTEKGRCITEELIERANQGIRKLTEHLSEEECRRFGEAVDIIEKILKE